MRICLHDCACALGCIIESTSCVCARARTRAQRAVYVCARMIESAYMCAGKIACLSRWTGVPLCTPMTARTARLDCSPVQSFSSACDVHRGCSSNRNCGARRPRGNEGAD
eukprot:6175354-Pleurochrysis_carterae.AAC.4